MSKYFKAHMVALWKINNFNCLLSYIKSGTYINQAGQIGSMFLLEEVIKKIWPLVDSKI